MKGRFKKMAWS